MSRHQSPVTLIMSNRGDCTLIHLLENCPPRSILLVGVGFLASGLENFTKERPIGDQVNME